MALTSRKKYLLFALAPLAIAVIGGIAAACPALALTFSPQVDIGVSGDVNPNMVGEFIRKIYVYALGAVGVVATVVMMYGGVLWITAGGNQERVGQARNYIAGALAGLVLLLSSYTILYFVNPQLISFRPLDPRDIAPPEAKTAAGTAACPPDLLALDKCRPCLDCAEISVPAKNGKKINSLFNSLLSGAYKRKTVDWWVTEAWPPTVAHANSCHYNGTCVDVNLTSGSTEPADVHKVYQNLKLSGLRPVYETKDDCHRYLVAGIECKVIENITAPHFSVYQ